MIKNIIVACKSCNKEYNIYVAGEKPIGKFICPHCGTKYEK